MQASETKLQDIIEGTKQYIIPMFQRSYSWKKENWQLLWDDILELYESEHPYPHFMGSIVTMQTDSLPEGVPKFVLIDGQQRLTTIFILLSVLRDFANKNNLPHIADEINNRFLVNTYNRGTDYFKLQPTQIDRNSFHALIKLSSTPDIINDNGINNCYLFFEKKIKVKDLDLNKLKNIICSNLILVRILLGRDDNPYLVFESLNAKGRPLTQADLIRNYFFMQIKPEQQEKIYQQYWLPMEELLGDNLTEFIRHYLTRNGSLVNKNEVYFELKEIISRGNPISYLQEICQFSQYYASFLNTEKETNPIIRKYLQRIKKLDVATVYPFLLNCFHDYYNQTLTETDLLATLRILENYVLRRFICTIQTRGLNRIFAVLYGDINKQINLESTNFIQSLTRILQRQKYPQNNEFTEKLMTVELYGINRTEKGRLILESLEESFAHKEQVSFDQLSIEHIMPQTLNERWKNDLGENYEITHELLLHTLGNLTLTGYNSELSNSNFSVKKAELNKSHLELNKYFNNVNLWSKEEIEQRAEILADMALKIWPYFGDKNLTTSHKSKVTGATPQSVIILNKENFVKSWRDVLEITLNAIIDYDEDKFTEIVQKFPRFLSYDYNEFRSNRQLKNSIYVNVNLSANDIKTFCQKALETADLSSEDWQVKTID